MTDSIQIGRWVLRPDVERTKEAHAKLTKSGSAGCMCTACANFEACRPVLMSGPLGDILSELGIVPPWEVEAHEFGCREPSGLHLYFGWFHVVGILESGADGWRRSGPQSWEPHFESLSPTLSIGFSSRLYLVRPSFEGLPLVQLDFRAELPWVIDAEEPL